MQLKSPLSGYCQGSLNILAHSLWCHRSLPLLYIFCTRLKYCNN